MEGGPFRKPIAVFSISLSFDIYVYIFYLIIERDDGVYDEIYRSKLSYEI